MSENECREAIDRILDSTDVEGLRRIYVFLL